MASTTTAAMKDSTSKSGPLHGPVAVLTTHPVQYHAPLIRKLSETLGGDLVCLYGGDFSVVGYTDSGFGAAVKWDVPLLDGYRSEFLHRSTAAERASGEAPPILWRLPAALLRLRPRAIILMGGASLFWVWAIFWSRLFGIPVYTRMENSEVAVARKGWRASLRSAYYRGYFSLVRGALAIGTHSRNHYLAHGMAPEKVRTSFYCVDEAVWGPRARQPRPAERSVPGLGPIGSGDRVFLFCGKLVEKKDPVTLVRAVALLSPEARRRAVLLFAGDGPLRPEVTAELAKIPEVRSHITGFLNQGELHQVYRVADFLVLPSVFGETWGLVVNEAMHFGIIPLVSNKVGSAPDLVAPLNPHFVFEPRSPESCAEALSHALSLSNEAEADLRRVVSSTLSRASLARSVDELAALLGGRSAG